MKRLIDLIRRAIATSFGFGMSPIVPGTVGTIPAVAVFVAVCLTVPDQYVTYTLLAGLVVASVFCIALGGWAERTWGKDPRRFVTDEVAGYLLTVSLFRVESLVITVIWTFVVTRFFDVVKPPPVRQMERFPAGWGILLDDLVASLYAVAVLHALLRFFPGWFSF